MVLMLFVVVGFAMSPVMAKTYQKKIKVNKHGIISKDLGKRDILEIWVTSNDLTILTSHNYKTYPANSLFIAKYHRLTKAKVTFVKKVNGKNKYYTKNYKPKYHRYGSYKDYYIDVKVPKGWKKYTATVYYKKI